MELLVGLVASHCDNDIDLIYSVDRPGQHRSQVSKYVVVICCSLWHDVGMILAWSLFDLCCLDVCRTKSSKKKKKKMG